MADGMSPAAEAAGDLYDRDFYLWTQSQAAALRAAAGRDPSLDCGNLAEEIESLGRSDVRGIRSRVAAVIEHLLKLEASPARERREGWLTVGRARRDLRLILDDSPALRRRATEFVADETGEAAAVAVRALREHGEDPAPVQARLAAGGYTADQVLAAWWPETPPPAA